MNGLPTVAQFDASLKSIPVDNMHKFIDKWTKIAHNLKAQSLEKDHNSNWDIDVYPRAEVLTITFRVHSLALTAQSYWGQVQLKFTNDHKESSKRGARMVKGVRLTSKTHWGKTSNKSMTFQKVASRLGNEFTEMWNGQLKAGFKYIEQEKVAQDEIDLVRKEVTDCGGVDIEHMHGQKYAEWAIGELRYDNNVVVKYTHGTEQRVSKLGRALTINNLTTEQMQTILKSLTPNKDKTYLVQHKSWGYLGVPMMQDGKRVDVMQADVRCSYADSTTDHPDKSEYTVMFSIDDTDGNLPSNHEYYIDGKPVVGADRANQNVVCPYCGRNDSMTTRLFSNVVVCEDTEVFTDHQLEARKKITYDADGKLPVFEVRQMDDGTESLMKLDVNGDVLHHAFDEEDENEHKDGLSFED